MESFNLIKFQNFKKYQKFKKFQNFKKISKFQKISAPRCPFGEPLLNANGSPVRCTDAASPTKFSARSADQIFPPKISQNFLESQDPNFLESQEPVFESQEPFLGFFPTQIDSNILNLLEKFPPNCDQKGILGFVNGSTVGFINGSTVGFINGSTVGFINGSILGFNSTSKPNEFRLAKRDFFATAGQFFDNFFGFNDDFPSKSLRSRPWNAIFLAPK